MFKDSTYSAWYRTRLGEGTGIARFIDGKLWGRDSILFYDGTYETAGDQFTAIVRTRRHTAGHATIFGIDEFELKLEGTTLGNTVQCSGTADVAPGEIIKITLIPCQSAPATIEPPPAPKRDVYRLPKLPARSRGR